LFQLTILQKPLSRAMMKYNFLFGFLLFFTLAFGQSKVWTLQECIEYAHENNLTVQQNALNLRSAEISKDAAVANLFPDLNFGGGYFWQFGFSIDPVTNVRRRGDRQTSSFTLSSQWVLFDGLSNYKQISKARLDYMASLYSLDAIKNDISINIASAYLQVLLNKQVLEVAENQLDISKNQLDRNKKLYDAGAIPKGDHLQFEAQYASDEQSVIAAENNLTISLLQLAQILQLDDYQDFDIVTPNIDNPDNALLTYTPEQIYDIALTNQPIIKSAEVNVESAQKQVGIAKAGYSPTISLSGQVNSNAAQDIPRSTGTEEQIGIIGSTEPGGGAPIYSLPTQVPIGFEDYPFFDQFGDNVNQFVGINLQVPIFNNFSIRSNVQNSELQLEQARLQLETEKNSLRQTIERAYADAYASLKTFNAAEKSLAANEESWKYAQKRYEEGALNLFDYETTRNRYLNAVSQLLQSKYDYVFKVKVLEFYLTNNITL
jgi:outer membrane protein